MSYLAKIKENQESLKNFIQEVQDEQEFLQETIDHKEDMIPLLIKQGYIPESIVKEFSKNPNNFDFLIDQFIENNYMPSKSFIDLMVDFGAYFDSRLLSLIEKFNVKIEMMDLIKLINDDFSQSSAFLIKNNKEFQKQEVFLLAMNLDSREDLWQLLIEDETLVRYIFEDYDGGNYSASFMEKMILNTNVKNLKVLKDITFCGEEISDEAFLKIVENSAQNLGISYTAILKWRNCLEDIDEEEISSYIKFDGVPPESKYRKTFIFMYPSQASDDEVIYLYENLGQAYRYSLKSKRSYYGNDTDKPATNILKEILGRNISLLKQVNLTSIKEKITPSKLLLYINRDEEKAMYLIKALPSKFKKKLLEAVSEENRDKVVKKTAKRSFFVEMFNSLKAKDLDGMRSYICDKYSLEQFVQDTHQSSKQEACQQTSISPEVLIKMEKEEFLLFLDSAFGFHGGYRDDLKLKYKLSVDEAHKSLDKLDEVFGYKNCEDKVSFIKKSPEDNYFFEKIYNSFGDEILSDSSLFKAFLDKTKSFKTPISPEIDGMKKALKVLTKEEFFEHFKFDSYDVSEAILMKDKNNKYVLSKEDILNYLTDQYVFEKQKTIENLMERDFDLAKSLVNAYSSGNKDLTKVLGKPVSFRRKQRDKDRLNKILDNMDSFNNEEEVIEEIVAGGSQLSEFKEKLINWEKALINYKKPIAIKVDHLDGDDRDICSFKEIPNLKVEVGTFGSGSSSYHQNLDLVEFPDNISVQKLIFDFSSRYNANKSDDIINLKKFLQDKNLDTFYVSESMTDEEKLALIDAGVDFEGSKEYFKNLLTDTETLASFDPKQLEKLKEKGFKIDKKFVVSFIEENSYSEENIQWIIKENGGDLKEIEILKGYFYAEVGEILKAAGATMPKDDEDDEEIAVDPGYVEEKDSYEVRRAKERILEEGKNFERRHISGLILKDKVKIIKFVEEEIDSRYRELNLRAVNLETLEYLENYDTIKKLISLDIDDLINLFKIPENLQKNKKLMKKFQELVSLQGLAVMGKIKVLKESIEAINENIDLEFKDFFEVQANDMEFSNNFNLIDAEAISGLSNLKEQFRSTRFLSGKKKKDIFKFLKIMSKDGRDARYIKDIMELITDLDANIANINYQVMDNEDINAVKASEERYYKVIKNVDCTYVHDQLVSLSKILSDTEESSKSLNQDIYSDLENNGNVQKELGYNLYFPRKVANFITLGETHGWCVSYVKGYREEAIHQGSIFFGICEEGKDSAEENVIALGHFEKDEDGRYCLGELKWSKHKKDGETNVNAYDDFAHEKIMRIVLDHCSKLNQEKESK